MQSLAFRDWMSWLRRVVVTLVSMDVARQVELARMSSGLFPPAAPVGFERNSSVVEVRESDGDAVVIFRWDGDSHLYGIPISPDDVRHEFFYPDFAVSSDDEWLESVSLGLGVMLDTGYRATARRTQVDDYIELGADGGWPVDDRFYLQVVDENFELLAERLIEMGLSPAVALQCHLQNQLMTWLLSYENNSTGGPSVGQAVVSRTGRDSAELRLVETTAGVPDTVLTDLAYFVSHDAAAAGARLVTTGMSDSVLDLAGFEPDQFGVLSLDTSFLKADPDAARALLEADLAGSSNQWGRDRDLAGRPLPGSRAARLLHRLRWGASGTRPRTYGSYAES